MTWSSISKTYFLIGFLCFISSNVFGQDQKLSDSLILEYQSGFFQGDELALLKRIVAVEANPERQLKYSELLIEKASKDSLLEYLYNGYLQKGNALYYMGNNGLALESYFQSLKYANRIESEVSIGGLMISIAGTHAAMENSNAAKNYYNKGIQLLRKVNDSVELGTALLNAGDEYLLTRKLDTALLYTRESAVIFNNINSKQGKAYSLGNMGMIYAEQGNDELAETNINEAISILDELEDYYPISVYLTYMADIYANKEDMTSAFNYAQRSLDLARRYQLKDQISDAHLKLSELYELQNNSAASLNHYKDHIVYRDSVKNIEEIQNIANLEVSQKQLQVNLLEEKKKAQNIILYATLGVLLLIGVLAMGLFKRNKFIKATNKIIEGEKARSDKLLLNILPQETADELKVHGKVKAKRFESVSVLFTDFEGFTKYSEHLSPEALVETVDYYFSEFDKIIKKHNLEKIKTIGDAYMCAGGLPFPSDDHANRVILAAFEIAAFVDQTQKAQDKENLNFNVRIGVNTGPVVAGVVGSTKFAYDIWGDTVNIAARMESNSGLGKINISENTYHIIKDDFDCEYRGEIDAKNRGMMKMYFVNTIKQNHANKVITMTIP